MVLMRELEISHTSVGEGIGSSISSAAQSILGRVEVASSLVLSTIGIGPSGVTKLLGGGLVAI
jgi:hypothetical protein